MWFIPWDSLVRPLWFYSILGMFWLHKLKRLSNKRNNLCASRLHRGIHRRDQRNLVQLQPLHVSDGCTRHSCASEIPPHQALKWYAGNVWWKVIRIFFVSTCFLQLICEVLALKNDIIAWRKKKSMVGISRMSSEKLNIISHTDYLDSITLFKAWLRKVFFHFSNWPTVVGSSVALSLFFADFSPPAWRDQFAGASSCRTGSMHGGIWNVQSPPKESDKGELNLLYLQVWKVFKVFNIRLQWKASKLHVSTALFVHPHAHGEKHHHIPNCDSCLTL